MISYASRQSSFEKLKSEVNKLASGNEKKKDDRFWYPDVDKAGNGYAVIRFLDSPPNEDMPFVRIWSHGFKGPSGMWYIENSLTTIGKQDPVSELNSKLWNESSDDNSPQRKQARAQKRKLTYIANVLVVKDSAHPDNEGKVFLFKFGKKIFDKIKNKMDPEFEDETPMNPFDLVKGANFKVKIRNVEGYRNYDMSEFDSPAPLSKDADDIDRIWNQCYSLQAFLAPDQFKTYEELKAKLEKVLSDNASSASARKADEDEDREEPAPRKAAAAPSVGKTAEAPRAVAAASKSDDSLSFFEKLAEDDED
jgi:gp32 DNA binding protein like